QNAKVQVEGEFVLVNQVNGEPVAKGKYGQFALQRDLRVKKAAFSLPGKLHTPISSSKSTVKDGEYTVKDGEFTVKDGEYTVKDGEFTVKGMSLGGPTKIATMKNPPFNWNDCPIIEEDQSRDGK